MKKNIIQLLWMLLVIIMVRGVSYAQTSDGLLIGSGNMLRSEISAVDDKSTSSENNDETASKQIAMNEELTYSESYQADMNSVTQVSNIIDAQFISASILQTNVYDMTGIQNDSLSAPVVQGLSVIPPSLIKLIDGAAKKGFSIADF